MNNQIDDLAQECTEYVTGTIDGDFEKFDYKKFAQLINEYLVKYLESELNYYNNPGTYEPAEYYERCRVKADILNDVLNHVKYHYSKGVVQP